MEKKTVYDPLIYKGMEFIEDNKETGEATLAIDVIEEMVNVNGAIHGGMTFTLADYCAGAGCFALGYRVATMQASVNYIRAINKGRLIAKNTVLHHGRRSIVCDVKVNDDKGDLILSGTFTMAVIGRAGENLNKLD